MTTSLAFAEPADATAIKANARRIAEHIRDRDLSSEFDRLRKLPEDIVAHLRAAGIFRMNMPRIWGGPELSAMDQVEVVETLSWGDASVGWCAFIWCDSGIYSGYLDDAVARSLYPQLDLAQSGWVYPGGGAEPVDGGYLLSGHWIFGSGSNHCDRLAAGFVVTRHGEPVLNEAGRPQWKVALAKPEQFEILDTWYTMGLKGTGSTDYTTENLFVPTEHTFDLGGKAKRHGAIWARPDHFLRKMSGVPLGVARDALDRARDMLTGKRDRRSGMAYRDSPIVQQTIALAEGKLGAARAYVFESLRSQWHKLEAGEPLSDAERAAVVISRQQAFQAGREVTQMIFDLIGGDAVYARNPFERQLRDMNTACQHIVAQMKSLQAPGGLLLGSETASGDPML
ncbi:MAG: acyl-CoA dehydrogenase family protein [Pseudomonadales bacterium]